MENDWRVIDLLNLARNTGYGVNCVNTRRYSLWTFLPVCFIEQFNRFTNLWFLITGALQMAFSYLYSGVFSWTILVTVSSMIVLTMVKDAIGDLIRNKNDQKINSRLVEVWNGSRFENVAWKCIKVGNIIQLKAGDTAPADLLILAGSNNGCCFADLKLLKGRKNASERSAVRETQVMLSGWQRRREVISKLEGDLLIPKPNSDIDNFEGKLRLKGYPKAAPLSLVNFLPRDSLVMKTDKLLCVVVYVGNETKTMFRTKPSTRKVSRLETRVNKVTIAMVSVSVLASFICAAISSSDMRWDDHLNFFEHLLAYILLFQNIVPITTFFLLDLIRVIQTVLVKSGGKFDMTTTDLNDEIGQIEYLLTDKTGTMTTAGLSLKMCRIGTREYVSNSQYSNDSDESVDELVRGSLNLSSSLLSSHTLKLPAIASTSDLELNKTFLLSLVLCNNVFTQPDGELLAESADELAIVKGAEALGCKLLERSESYAKVELKGQISEYKVHTSIPFSSDTKRSTTLVQEIGTKTSVLLVKGAEGVMKQICKYDPNVEETVIEAKELSTVKCLRQIMFGYKVLTEDETKDLVENIEFAKGTANEEGKIVAALADYDNELCFIGAVYLEEVLRPQVSETVTQLKSAGIKVWMVTGDSAASSYATGVSSRITSINTEHLKLTKFTSQVDLKRTLTKAIKRCIYGEYEDVPLHRLNILFRAPTSARSPGNSPSVIGRALTVASIGLPETRANITKALAVNNNNPTEFLEEPFEANVLKYSMTIDGGTLQLALSDPDSLKILACLMFAAEAVIGCEMLAVHKADLVRLVQKNFAFEPRVMAVGDGNNDIQMIRQANVGVGISAELSSQAANSSDIMARDFSDLRELLLDHGVRSHSCLARSMLLAMYGNLTMTLLLFYYSFTSDYSASTSMQISAVNLFCLLFFILPLVAIGTVDITSLESTVAAYYQSFMFKYYSKKTVLRYVSLSLLHSGLVFLFVYPSFSSSINKEGRTETIDLIGVTMYLAMVFTVLLQSTLEIKRVSFFSALAYGLSVTGVVTFFVGSNMPSTDDKRAQSAFSQLQSSSVAVAAMLFAPAACYCLSLVFMAVNRSSVKIQTEKNSGRISAYVEGLNRVYKEYKGWKLAVETDLYKLNPFTAKFRSTYTEQNFKDFYYAYQLKSIRVSVGILTAISVIYTIAEAGLGDTTASSTVLRAGFSALLCGLLVLTALKVFKQVYMRVTLATVGVAVVGKFILEIVSNTDAILASSFTPPYIFTMLCFDYVSISLLSIVNIILSQISETIYLNKHPYTSTEITLLTIRLLILTLGITAISAAAGYSVEVNNRERFRLIELSRHKIQKTQAILSFLLPAFVKERVKDGVRYIAEDQGTVTIVFCDIYDFDRIVAEYTPTELTEFLDDFFCKLDQLCTVHGVTKIETVGKTYLACAGLKDSEVDIPARILNRTHARRGVDMALDILRTTKTFKLKHGELLKVKIGVNSGPVTAGVVGHHKPQFALVGDTVNTASRMCSTIPVPNTIQITASCYELMNRYEGLDFTDNEVEAKGKGLMKTKFVRENKQLGSILYESSMIQIDSSSTRVSNSTHSRQKNVLEDIKVPDSKETELISRICSFHCKETPMQKEFRVSLQEQNFQVILAGVVISITVNVMLLLVSILEYSFISDYAGPGQIVVRVVLSLLLVVLLTVLKKTYKSSWYTYLVSGLSLFDLVVALTSVIENSQMPINLAASELIFVLLYLSNSTGLLFVSITTLSVVFIAVWLAVAINEDAKGANYVIPSLYLIFLILVNLTAVFYRESNMRNFANLKLIVDRENEKTEKLLSYMMPAHVYENLKEGRAVTDRLPSVALLFADICGFTAWSSNKTPIEVVGMLSELFTGFDLLCEKHDVFKVCTIGDCYVVMGYTGLDYRDPASECAKVLEFGLAMIQVIKDLNLKHGSVLDMRIGIHIGEVIAGITGSNIVRYDIYGPDVIIANKMESGGAPGRINVSEPVKHLVESKLPNRYFYEFNADIKASSVNRVYKSYFVSEKWISDLIDS